MYIIRQKTHYGYEYWSNNYGWTELVECASMYSVQEKRVFNLPVGNNVEWVLLYIGDE